MRAPAAASAARFRLCRAFVFAVITVVLCFPALADEGPIVIGARPKTEFLHFDKITCWLDLDYRREDDTQEPKGAPKSTFTENRFQQTLTLQDTGYIVHPNLVQLNLSGTFGLEEDFFNQDGKTDHSTGPLYDYDLSALILRKEEAPVTVYARRSFETIGRQFGPSLDSTLMTNGILLEWRNKKIPTRIEFYRLDQEQKALDGSEHFTENQNTATWHSEYRPSDHNLWTWDYSFNTGDSTSDIPTISGGGETRNDFTTHDATLANQYDFGHQGRNRLNSTLSFFDQTGTFDLRRLHYSEILRLHHSDTFETNYRYTLDDQNIGGSQFGGSSTDQLLQRGEAQFVHHLYKSLTTAGTVGFQTIDESIGGSTEYFGRIAFDYVKQVPLGKLSAGAGFGYDHTENDARSQVTQVVNQPETFVDPLPAIIPGRNIVPGSIVVTDTSDITVYRQNFDYTVHTFSDHVALDRILGGRIASGQTVFVDYRLAPQAANTVDTTTIFLSARYDFQRGPLKGLGVYARYLDNDQQISSDVPDQFVPNSLRDYIVGADYRFWELTLVAENEWHHSSISPYDQFRTSGQWVHPFTRDLNATLNATYSHTHYLDDGDELDALVVSGSGQLRLTRDLFATASVTWQQQNDQLFGNTRGLEEQLEVRWTHRQTSLFVRARNASLNTRATDSQYQTIEVGLRRNF
jgi:hypothetical protein